MKKGPMTPSSLNTVLEEGLIDTSAKKCVFQMRQKLNKLELFSFHATCGTSLKNETLLMIQNCTEGSAPQNKRATRALVMKY